MLYSIGLQYLPVTTLICTSQLGFNAVFTYFLNKQNFTPYIVNSLGLLTISSVLLVIQSELDYPNKTSIYQNLIATLVILIGFFAGGDWKKMSQETKEYKLGQVSYVMNLFWTAVCWQAFNVGCVGLMFKVSSLFSNIIGVLGLPVSPVLAAVFLNEKLTGLKAMAMLLAMWGFVSYMYQYYLDDLKMKEKIRRDNE
ncbi:probable purine permease 9 [Phtheirospermum japonicum]|uniref:Probable purine permease 9 n=1 Tax=Phtheirospermum japonicum TaxID=374723 RepID=A0A830BVA4_9LAMI|nr:probable purine permease 9 [Phtheirospermum japonicum]